MWSVRALSQRAEWTKKAEAKYRRAHTHTKHVHSPKTDHVAGVDGGGVVHAEVVAIGTDVDTKDLEPAGVRATEESGRRTSHTLARATIRAQTCASGRHGGRGARVSSRAWRLASRVRAQNVATTFSSDDPRNSQIAVIGGSVV